MLDFLPSMQDLMALSKIPLFLVALSLLMTFYEILFFLFSKRTQGTIVDFIHASGSRGRGIVYRPVFKYTTKKGKEYTANERSGSNPPKFSIGQNVPVHYLRFSPRRAKITRFTSMFSTPLMIGAAGLLFLVLELSQK